MLCLRKILFISLFAVLISCSTTKRDNALRYPSSDSDEPTQPKWNRCELFLAKRSVNALLFATKRPFDLMLTRETLESLDEFTKTNNTSAVPAESLIGQALEFEEMLAWIIHQMPQPMRVKILEMADAFAKTEINIERHEGILAKTIDLKQPLNIYRPFAVGANKGSRVIWSTDPIGDVADLYYRAEKTLDILALARFAPVHKFAVYRASQKRFVRENLALLTEAIIQKSYLFEKYPELVGPPKSKVKRALRIAESFLVAFSPYNWTGVAPAEFNTRYREILETKGPQGVYREILKTRGIALGVEYWYTHLANSYQIVGVVIVGFVIPQIGKLFKYLSDDDDDDKDDSKLDQLPALSPQEIREFGGSINEFIDTVDKNVAGIPMSPAEKRVAQVYLGKNPEPEHR